MSTEPSRNFLDFFLHLSPRMINEVFSARIHRKLLFASVVNPNDSESHTARCELDREMTETTSRAYTAEKFISATNFGLATREHRSPITMTHCPGCAPLFFNAAYDVTPAHSIGAAAAESSPSGMGVT